MTPLKQFKQLSPNAQQIVRDYIQRRGIPPSQFEDYLQPVLPLDSNQLPQIGAFVQRLARAVVKQERILIYGDYDADGITATAILVRCLREAAGILPLWALPNRQHDHYGLDLEKAKWLYGHHQPQLLITLDNGTNSSQAIAWLKNHGVDTLIIDHHPLDGAAPEAVALVNPSAHGRDTAGLCAAGLTLFCCQHFVKNLNTELFWTRDVAITLAGIGTLADAVRLTPVNRALIKSAMRLLKDAGIHCAIPGLAELLAHHTGEPDQRFLQFDLIPKINAAGRLSVADPVVSLLANQDPEQARAIARNCADLNGRRKQMQRQMERQAAILAEAVVNQHPDTPVLVLAGQDWHHGVAGPTAGHIAERFQRSTILLAPYTEHLWKGSGRGANGEHLGKWLAQTKSLGLVERGGGHAGAIGLAVTSAQLAPLQSAGLFLEIPQVDCEPETEVIGEFSQLRVHEWAVVLQLLAPFGRCNPHPLIAARRARLQSAPTELRLKDDGAVWAVKGTFKIENQFIKTVWRDVARAAEEWHDGTMADLTLELVSKTMNGRFYQDWSVIRCAPIS